ncbi:MAG: hypothetical protein WC635_10880 [Bacteriovorax sp.]
MGFNIYTLCVLMLLNLSLSGCAVLDKFKTPDGDIEFNPKQLRDYTTELEAEEKYKAPFIASYTYGEKNLVFVATLHTSGAGNTTHKSIEKAFNEFKPDFLIVEGSAFTIISDPDDIAYSKACVKRKFKYCGEDAYAISQALKAKIPFSYGEPGDASVFEVLKKNAIAAEEMIVFYTLKNIPQWRRTALDTREDLKTLWNRKLNETLTKYSKKFGASPVMNAENFKKIYKAKMGADFNFINITDATISPQIDKNPTWINKMAHAVDVVRENFLVNQMEKRLNKYKKVLVVYGVSHLVKQREMLSNTLGDSTDMSVHQKLRLFN